MRIYREPIEVRRGVVGDVEGPAQFLWRGKLWLVRGVETRWTETGPWWDSPAARAVRTGAVKDDGDLLADDLLSEEETWRVAAANGRLGESGVYELTHTWATGEWRMSRVVD